jgi:hypothetical protein
MFINNTFTFVIFGDELGAVAGTCTNILFTSCRVGEAKMGAGLRNAETRSRSGVGKF